MQLKIALLIWKKLQNRISMCLSLNVSLLPHGCKFNDHFLKTQSESVKHKNKNVCGCGIFSETIVFKQEKAVFRSQLLGELWSLLFRKRLESCYFTAYTLAFLHNINEVTFLRQLPLKTCVGPARWLSEQRWLWPHLII